VLWVANKIKNRLKDTCSTFVYYNNEIVKIKRKFSKIDLAKNVLIRYYRSIPKTNKPKISRIYDGLSSTSRGIGDAVCSSAFYHVAANQKQLKYLITKNPYHSRISAFNPYYIDGKPKNIFPTEKLSDFNVGNGHLINQFQRVLGLKTEAIPKTYLKTNELKIPNKIAFNFSTGGSAFFKTNYHLPRQLTNEQKFIFQRFINERKDYEFIEVDKEFHQWENCINKCGLNITDTIKELSTCNWYIGLNSGPLHLAAGLGLNLIQIINIPHAQYTYLPILREQSAEDLVWLYPTYTLHRNDEHELVKIFTLNNLNKCLQKEIYPYDNQF